MNRVRYRIERVEARIVPPTPSPRVTVLEFADEAGIFERWRRDHTAGRWDVATEGRPA